MKCNTLDVLRSFDSPVDLFLFLSWKCENPVNYLYHDEISSILKSCPNGAKIEIWCFPDVDKTYTIRRTSSATLYTSETETISHVEMIETIYFAIESENLVTIDNNDILRL